MPCTRLLRCHRRCCSCCHRGLIVCFGCSMSCRRRRRCVMAARPSCARLACCRRRGGSCRRGLKLQQRPKQEVLHDGQLGQHLGLVHLDHAAVHLQASRTAGTGVQVCSGWAATWQGQPAASTRSCLHNVWEPQRCAGQALPRGPKARRVSKHFQDRPAASPLGLGPTLDHMGRPAMSHSMGDVSCSGPFFTCGRGWGALEGWSRI